MVSEWMQSKLSNSIALEQLAVSDSPASASASASWEGTATLPPAARVRASQFPCRSTNLQNFSINSLTVRRCFPEHGKRLVLVIMGVVGSGKTTIGVLLAQKLEWEFADADDFH